ncbi:uncharacterized protein B0I36DRAFT_364487 [Microdochium trichocladiopsis]|uniref:Uncharacterized protein n=1 Tax=Microdochium trichocladiopsis TaxID=1682393 RepID=A0A9P8Y144_9PEZI|nr:uncharacterized protein B0I36DRAFT_364487 [Microdochium trichocladiopsis]KAH7027255.1 hypothetical protein B0I36DRAFT_364487 [Microdochium trichocladiopsis]
MTATASPPHPTAQAHHDIPPSEAQPEPHTDVAVQNGHQDDDDSSDSLSDLDDQFDDASEFDAVDSGPPYTNGNPDASPGSRSDGLDLNGDEPPAKRQRTRDSTPPPRPRQKPISPPWKKIEAEGPTSFIENGRRKSGRTNLLPRDMQPPGKRRQTRHVPQSVNGSANGGNKDRATARTPVNGQANGSKRRLSSSSKATPVKPTSTSAKRSFTQPVRPPPKPTGRRRSSPPPPPKRNLGTRRSSRALRHDGDNGAADEEDDTGSKPTKIKLRLKPTFIPLVHPLQANVLPGQTLPRPRVSDTFAEYIHNAPALEIAAGGWLDPADDGQQYTEEQIKKDARIILRIEEETEPGGS